MPLWSSSSKLAGANSRQAREQQGAAAAVLKVISHSTFDLQKLFETLVETAARLCHAQKANIARVKGDNLEYVAVYGFEPKYLEYMLSLRLKIDRGSLSGRAVLEGGIVHIPDVLADPEFTMFDAQKRGGFRTALSVPLLREGVPIGVFFLTRHAIDPFTQEQIELVSIFADQAVIAIENTRLLSELRESVTSADRDRRRAQGHQSLDLRPPDGARDAGRVGSAPVRGGVGANPSPTRFWILLFRKLWPFG